MNTLPILSPDKIKLNMKFANKTEAINYAGRLLVDAGHVSEEYVPKMLEREKIATTYVGNGLAIPHGTREALKDVRAAGVSIIQVPDGVDFGDGNVARLVIGLAANGNDHLDILTGIAEVCSDDAKFEQLVKSSSAAEIIDILQKGMTA